MTGYELKLWRRGMNWTQERAAEEFGISLATYKRYEKGGAAEGHGDGHSRSVV
ncbi:helix-turn-helix domain-containing protein [Escherichia coli]|uniref:Helix-turn-helix n=1 Tax=Escherichia coli TaxID=562 RepID=A0AAX2KKB4_ECOLX|nr:Helix-turn-helix [Escherichia coli]STO17957.1 Helix-turn-helix [Escherichia coli]STO18092.1 Helix-turn-helix [Escherichia coli]